MPEPVSADIITTPSNTGQPYDPCDNGPCGRWAKLEDNAGAADIHTGRVHGEFPDSAPWRQV